MSRLLLPLCLLLAAIAAPAFAQEQEKGLLERIDSKRRLAIESMNGSGKKSPELTSPLASKSYGASTFVTKNFGTGSFRTKDAQMKTYATKSFFGIKNPWFGKTTFETSASRAAGRSARESAQQFQTEAFAVNAYGKAGKQDALTAAAALPANTQPRPYLGPGKPDPSEGVDKFTQNLSRDLSIDDVRDLLNKGKSQ